ncbi:MAG: glycosyltransferase family 2 protein [Flavobacteriaceae bacterium]|nr:glycosyltransferase family 2 protein [Flavobacteriaceae bacterium]
MSKKIEVLISTMHRNSLEFLDKMFQEVNVEHVDLLIINQTNNSNQLNKTIANKYNILDVINSNEKGLAKSRNLAIKNAKNSICLIADDDVRYLPELDEKILQAFEKHKEADIISFQMVDEFGRFFKPYKNITMHDKKTMRTVNSVVIAFRKERVIENKVWFNENFGLGAEFQTADEYVFLRDALKAKLKVYFEPVVILEHAYKSSGKSGGSDRLVYARAALFYKYEGVVAYLRLCRYLYLVHREKMIATNEIFKKFKVGLKGINKYKELVKQGKEVRCQ